MPSSATERYDFIKSLLQDIEALEHMLDNDFFENNIKRIGAEQELVIVNKKSFRPSPIAPEIISNKKDREWLVPELSKYNLEINLPPYELQNNCFSAMETLLSNQLKDVDLLLDKYDAKGVLTGILPTMRKSDLEKEYISPYERYYLLLDALSAERGNTNFELRMSGIDELLVKHESPLIEACNTSFQVHLQVSTNDFRKYYNHSLALTAPLIAISSNSPLVFGKRLWHESRIALFQQAIDTRSSTNHMREKSPRVILGTGYLHKNVLDLYKEDLSRFKILAHRRPEFNSLDILKKGQIPGLKSLLFHNSTVYRWNRPCYGISDNGQPHLRIENRVIPSGPSVMDEMANAAFWVGCMEGFADTYEDVRELMSFDDVRDNFSKAARMGIDSKFTWFKDQKITAKDLILEELLPIARRGLEKNKVDNYDIDRFLGVIEERTKAHMTGARWMLRGYTKLTSETTIDEALSAVTSSIMENQDKPNNPIHKWNMPDINDLKEYLPLSLSVSEFMDTELFTVQADDPLELVAELMDYNRIRYTLVEDGDGKLAGLLSAKLLLKTFVKKSLRDSEKVISAGSIMIDNPISISPEKTISEAIKIMTENQIGCLPVVKGEELVGVITEQVFVDIASKLIRARK